MNMGAQNRKEFIAGLMNVAFVKWLKFQVDLLQIMKCLKVIISEMLSWQEGNEKKVKLESIPTLGQLQS